MNEKWNAIKDSEEVIMRVDGLLNELKAVTMKHKGGLLSSVPEMPVVEVVVAGVSDEAEKNGSGPGTSANI